ncbi:hypothetical protein niasHS_012677 [Heterodera schachtii]|uniref:DUF659 domain-containing protein n=1 Tax=Heterodera schachtii TaxID=97005 RepID=A0ABD2IPD4_HETSC
MASSADRKCAFPPVVFVVGGPGCGKGTQCERIVEKFGFTHLSSGDLLRAEVASGSVLGKQLKATMDAGGLVPLDKVLAIVKAAMLKKRESSNGFLIDGYPREVTQGERFEQEIQSPVLVIYFEANDETLVKRLMGRGRSDDNVETIKNRLHTFVESTKPVVDHYGKQGKLVKVIAATSTQQQQLPIKNSQIPCTQFAHLKQHNETAKHKAKLERNKGGQQQQFLTTINNVPNQFNLDLCDSFVWISVDETTDKMGRAVANLLIGKLDGQKWHNPHLISVKCLEKVDSAGIARFVNEGLDNFFSNGFDKNRVLLLVTDAAAYMKKAGKQLKVFYTNLIHTLCLCHSLHRVAEKVRDEFKKVDKLIAKTKAVFVKAPQRSNIYHRMFPDLAMPPKAVLTRWGTWLQAVSFYWQNFEAVKEVVNSFDPTDASCIRESQSCFTLSTWQDLAYIHTNFGNLCPAIAKLESQGLSIMESMEIFCECSQPIGQRGRRESRNIPPKNLFHCLKKSLV